MKWIIILIPLAVMIWFDMVAMFFRADPYSCPNVEALIDWAER
jgi:hypothetical protein